MRLIGADALNKVMYHEAFETDSDIRNCANCALRKTLEKWDYTDVRNKGVPKTEEEGFACLAFTHEGIVIHSIGGGTGCELWTERKENEQT